VRKTAKIENDQHVFIAGMTGSGKTVLAKVYLAGNTKPVYVLDSKGTFVWNEVPNDKQITIETIKDLQKAADKFQFVIYRPRFEELNFDTYNEFFQFCYFRRKCTVLVDEAMEICPNTQRIPPFYKGILTRGRELDVNVWSCTQRPSGIPVIIYSEASHWFIFKLQNPADREKMANYSGFDEFMQTLPMFYFLYWTSIKSDKPPIRGTLKFERGAK